MSRQQSEQKIRSIRRIAIHDTSAEISRSAVESKTSSMITKQTANEANIHSRFSTDSTVRDLLQPDLHHHLLQPKEHLQTTQATHCYGAKAMDEVVVTT